METYGVKESVLRFEISSDQLDDIDVSSELRKELEIDDSKVVVIVEQKYVYQSINCYCIYVKYSIVRV